MEMGLVTVRLLSQLMEQLKKSVYIHIGSEKVEDLENIVRDLGKRVRRRSALNCS
jgi:hypothetical protein